MEIAELARFYGFLIVGFGAMMLLRFVAGPSLGRAGRVALDLGRLNVGTPARWAMRNWVPLSLIGALVWASGILLDLQFGGAFALLHFVGFLAAVSGLNAAASSRAMRRAGIVDDPTAPRFPDLDRILLLVTMTAPFGIVAFLVLAALVPIPRWLVATLIGILAAEWIGAWWWRRRRAAARLARAGRP